MLDIKKLLTKIVNDFHGAVSSRAQSFGASTSIAPTKNGWLVATATASSSTGVAPVIRIQDGNSILSEGVGIASQGTALNCGAPVRAGSTYTINCYRCSISNAILYY